MSLRLDFPDKYRLWSDLVQGNRDRMFVPTDEPPRIDTQVRVELAVNGQAPHVVITGRVVGTRRRSERFSAGAYVRLDDEAIQSCRRFLGLSQSPERYRLGRKARRTRCELPVKFREPPLAEKATAVNLSETGLLVACSAELNLGQFVEIELELPEGPPLVLQAEVTRGSGETGKVGLLFVDLSREAGRRILPQLAPPRPSTTDGRQQSLVVADDDPAILEFLVRALSKFGYEIRKARRGEEAVAMIRAHAPRLVVLDILMPGLDGVDICKMMRADVELADVPVIFLSALSATRLHDVADEAGATDYLSKPVALADLLNVVGSYLQD